MAGRRDRGQSTVEFALGMPLVALMLLAVVQLGLVVRDQLAVVAAARAAARAASVSASPQATATRAAHAAIGLRPLDVVVDARADTVRIEVRYVARTDVALVGALLPDVTVRATATMAFEPP